MGLFSTKKKIYVSSTVYKVVDDGSDRADFVRETIAGVALTGDGKTSYADALQAGIRNGPRSIQRGFFRWAKTNLDPGMPRAAINYTETIDDIALAAEILSSEFAGDTANTINILNSFIDNADESYYAEQWIYENEPEKALLAWASDADPVTDDIYIQWPDETSTTINVPGLDSSIDVLVAYYTVTNGEVTSNTKVFIYVLGSGNTALDNRKIQVSSGSGVREFYPFLPIRINNVSVFDPGSPALPYEAAIRKAWKKAMGTDMQLAIDQVDSNPEVGDIDYAYLVFGVCLNTTDKAEKAYIYEFFKLLEERQTLPSSAFNTWATTNDTYGYHTRFEEGLEQVNSAAINSGANPGFIEGATPAAYGTAPRLEEVHLTLPSSAFGVLDMKITWGNIAEQTHTGVAKYGAKVGDVFILHGYQINNQIEMPFFEGFNIYVNYASGIAIRKQISPNQYSEILIDGLLHKNLIYKNKEVVISGQEALQDSDDSGFIIPLHEPTLKRLGAVKATDVAKESFLMVFNSYQVVKKKWYQSGIFGFILAVIVIVVAVVITVITAGAGSPAAAAAGAGILGSAAAVGGALGFTGLLAIAIGAAANAIAAMIVLQLVNVAGSAVFGEKIGRILTAVAAVIMTLGTGPNGFSFDNVMSSAGWGNMAAIDKLALMTNAASDLVGSIQQDQLEGILKKTQNVLEEYNEEMDKLEELMKELDTDGIIDPSMLVDFTSPLQEWNQMGQTWQRAAFFGETPQDFLDRTLLSGSDLIELSHSMVTDFVDAALTLP